MFHRIILLITFISLAFIPTSLTFQKSITCNVKTDSNQYLALTKRIDEQRDSIQQLYIQNKTSINQVEEFLIKTYYNRIVPQWLGTKWEFYGKTEVPGYSNSIACGYFVVTSLKHLSIKLEDPVEMAENYSAYIISTLCDSSYKTKTAKELLAIINKHPDDVWVVGLSNHSGVLIKINGRIHFVHSSYLEPVAVVDEIAETSPAFNNSKIYVAGNLFVNNSLTQKWIMNEKVKFNKKF